MLNITELFGELICGYRIALPSLEVIDTIFFYRDAGAVHVDALVTVFDPVTREPHNALDIVCFVITRKTENHDVTTIRVTNSHDLQVDDREPNPILKLADQDKISDLQGWQHRA